MTEEPSKKKMNIIKLQSSSVHQSIEQQVDEKKGKVSKLNESQEILLNLKQKPRGVQSEQKFKLKRAE